MGEILPLGAVESKHFFSTIIRGVLPRQGSSQRILDDCGQALLLPESLSLGFLKQLPSTRIVVRMHQII